MNIDVKDAKMRHSSDCQCDACLKRNDPFYASEIEKQRSEAFEQKKTKLIKAYELMDFLDIPCCALKLVDGRHIGAIDLHDIFIDEEKLKILISKLRNRAFW